MLTYRVVPNALTVEPSYRAEVVQDIIGLEQIVDSINSMMPAVDPNTINSVINTLRAVIVSELNNGRSVNIEGFVRFFPSIVGRLDLSDSAASINNVQVNAAVSVTFESDAKNGMSLTKQPYVERTPVLVSVVDANNEQNFLGVIITIKGDGLGFTPSDNFQGIFIENTSDNTRQRMSVYASVTNGQVVGLNDMVTTPIDGPENEFLILAKVRYTPNGNLRTGVYGVPSRYTRQLSMNADVLDDPSIFNSYLG